MNFYLETLSRETKKIFEVLGNVFFISDFYLAGGTALALQIGHRQSFDLDFFSQKTFDESNIIQQLSSIGEFQLEKKSPQTIIGILNGVKVSFLGYQYPILLPLRKILNIGVADILDIACMKIDAIASRGTKRDFIDIYFVAKEFISLEELLEKFKEKYTSLNYNMMHVKKALVYFVDAEKDPMPVMLKPVSWGKVKKFFEKEIIKL